MNKKGFLAGLTFFLVSLLLFVSILNAVIPKSNTELTKQDFLSQKQVKFSYIAIGDSLTEGVGDTTDQGGFIPLLSQELTSTYQYKVEYSNYGVSGNTSKQILKRMKTESEIEQDLKKADLMTLTVGGNDVMAVIRKNLTKLEVSSFVKPASEYQS